MAKDSNKLKHPKDMTIEELQTEIENLNRKMCNIANRLGSLKAEKFIRKYEGK